MDGFIKSPVSHKALALGIMAGGLVLLDSALPGTGMLLAVAIGLAVMFRSNASDWIVRLFNYGAKPYVGSGPNSESGKR